jgi:2'-5' RNA ligase
MVHSIELVFDQDTESAIRRIWDSLREAGVPSQAPASRPHVTLTVAQQIDADVDALLTPLAVRFPLPCRIGAALVFGRSADLLARIMVPTAELLAVHAEVYRLALPQLAPSPLPHTGPGQWTPHVTLARHVGQGHLAKALRIAGKPSEIAGSFSGLRRWDGDKRVQHPIG